MRKDFEIIISMIKEKSKVLDLGCGEGELLFLLKRRKNIIAKGIERNEKKVINSLAKGISVFHGDMEDILPQYATRSYDYIILSLTLHETMNPGKILKETLRVGKNVIVSFPNFGHWKVRFNVLFKGELSKDVFPEYHWFSKHYVHFITVKKFECYCKKRGILILRKIYYNSVPLINKNLFTYYGIYCLQGISSI